MVRSVLAERANLPCLAARTACKVSGFIHLCWSCSEVVWQYVTVRDHVSIINCRWKPYQKASFSQKLLKHILVLQELSEERMWTLILRYSFSLIIFLSLSWSARSPRCQDGQHNFLLVLFVWRPWNEDRSLQFQLES